jgi:hypothetical protein
MPQKKTFTPEVPRARGDMKKNEESEDGTGRREKSKNNPTAERWRLWSSRSLPALAGRSDADRSAPAGAKSKRRWAGRATRSVVHAVHGRGSIHRKFWALRNTISVRSCFQKSPASLKLK